MSALPGEGKTRPSWSCGVFVLCAVGRACLCVCLLHAASRRCVLLCVCVSPPSMVCSVGGIECACSWLCVVWSALRGRLPVIRPVQCVCAWVWDTGEGHAVDVRSANCRERCAMCGVTLRRTEVIPEHLYSA
jgi:hypothetical protein